jgi:RNA polymerase sigma-70 factor (ECF subfamily)
MKGTEKDIKKLCSDTWEQLYRFVYYKVQNREEAEDITQETYIKAISYIQKNNVNIDKYVSFLKTVSLNVLRDRWRKSKRMGQSVNFDDINSFESAVEDHSQILAQREIVENALSRLNEEQRSIIELRILKGYSVADTAKKTGKTESNVRVLQHRALQILASLLKEQY